MDQPNNDNSTQPGSLNFTPPKPELGPIETIVPSIEIPHQEIEPSGEKLTAQPDKPTDSAQTADAAGKTATSGPQTAKIVDKSKDPLHLHPIKNAKDTLTKEADVEEEEFITQVEAAHEHK